MRTALVAALLLSASPSGALLVVAEDLSSVRADTCVIGSESGPPTFEDPIELLPPNPGTGWLTSGGYCGAGYGIEYSINPEAGLVSAWTMATKPYHLTATDLRSTVDLWLVTDTEGWIEARGTATYLLNGQTYGGDATTEVLAGVPFRITVSVAALESLDVRSGTFQFHPTVPEVGTAVLVGLGLAMTIAKHRSSGGMRGNRHER